MADQGGKFILPSPKFEDEVKDSLATFSRHRNPHFSTPNGMLLPRDKQPPPMYGPRGATIPPRYMGNPRKRPAPPDIQPRANANRGPCFPGSGASKSRVDKEVIPQLLRLDWKLWCEGCDVNCCSEAEFQNHLANHMPCTVSECKFIGHPLVMKKHMRQVHSTEQNDKKIGTAPSREEIEQWRQERRKRYPTKGNVLLRQQAQEERLKRGERITENKERFPNSHDASRTSREKVVHKGQFDTHPVKKAHRKRRNKGPKTLVAVEETSGRIMFKGTTILDGYKNSPQNALGMLGEYGTDSENESDDEATESNDNRQQSQMDEKAAKCPSRLSDGEIVDDEDSHAETLKHAPQKMDENRSINTEVVIIGNVQKQEVGKIGGDLKDINTVNILPVEKVHAAVIPVTEPNHKPTGSIVVKQHNKSNNWIAKNGRKKRKYLLDFSKLQKSKQNTMLEKLLDSDIRHERNVLLQCVRHVCLSNFFGIGQSKESALSCSNENEKIKE